MLLPTQKPPPSQACMARADGLHSPEMSPSGPTMQRGEVTNFSRMGSMAGLVTWGSGVRQAGG
jgi:hypothetical protein